MSNARRDSKHIELSQPLISDFNHILDIAPLYERKDNPDDREDYIRILKTKRDEILKAIKLLQKGIRKRHLPIQVGMGLVMMGTGIYLISNLIEYIEYKDHTVPQLQMESKNEKSLLNHSMQQLIGSLNYLKKNMTETFFSIHCEPRSIGGYCGNLLCPDDRSNCPVSRDYIKWYSDQCGVINIYNFTGCVPQSPTVDNCFRSIESYCATQSSLTTTFSTLENINYFLESLNNPDAIFYAATNGMLYYYLLTCGLGEFAPGVVLMLTLVSHVFTNCFSSPRLCFNLSKEESDEILNIAENNEIEGNLTSYPKILKQFQNKIPLMNKMLDGHESRLAVCMAKKELDLEATPISSVFNDPIGEPQLLNVIFDMAGKSDSVIVREESAPMRLCFEKGGHANNGPSPVRNLTPLFSLFKRLKEEKSEEHEGLQGAYSANQVLRNVYEFAGFLTTTKVSR